jgi:hypothetical protein
MQSSDPPSNPNYSITRTILPSNLVTPSLHSSSLQVAAHPPSSTPVTIPAVDDMEWESPPAEILQEWIKTSQMKTKPTKTNTRGPPGRLSPPNDQNSKQSHSSTNFYSALEDLPISQPPVDCNLTQKTPRKAQTSAPKTATPDKQTNTKTTPQNNPGQPRNSSPGIQKPRPTTLPTAALPFRDQSILDIFASKHAKKGSP